MSNVFVVDTNKQPLNPAHPGRARMLLKTGKAAVLRRYPFTLVLKTSVAEPRLHPLHLKLDPGSRTTGIALVDHQSGHVLFAAELSHRGQAIRDALQRRRTFRRGRRARQTRYRKPRFDNRRRPSGWLAPSLESRVCNILTWVNRLRTICPVAAISLELVRFDLQALENPDIEGCQYQQGTLAGYELREYLLEKFHRTCAYCGAKEISLQIEHIQARARGGSHRVSNLCLACEPCNVAKGTQDIAVFLAKKPEVLTRILAQAKAPLKDAAAVNTTRWRLYERLNLLPLPANKTPGLPVECGSGGRTTFNRITQGLEKAHWIDAACVGKSTPPTLKTQGISPLLVKATGHGRRQMCRTDAYGFPRTGPKQAKQIKGFQTGDMVKAIVPSGKKGGTYIGRVAVRATGSFNITTHHGVVQGISHRFCTTLHACDGYSHARGQPTLSTRKGRPLSSPV